MFHKFVTPSGSSPYAAGALARPACCRHLIFLLMLLGGAPGGAQNGASPAPVGICQARLGDPSARASLERSFLHLKDKPLRMQVGMELVSTYARQGDPEQAVPVLQKLVDLEPENADILYMAQQMYSELADDTLNKLAIVAPGSARMQQVIAERLVNAGDISGATEHYRKALEIDPHLPGVRYELAEAILESSRSDAAAQAEAEEG